MNQPALSMDEAKAQLLKLPEIIPLHALADKEIQQMNNLLHAFGPYLATRLGPRLNPRGFMLRCFVVIDDLKKGHDAGTPIENELVGGPAENFVILQHSVAALAVLIFPEEFADEVNQHYLDVRRRARQ